MKYKSVYLIALAVVIFFLFTCIPLPVFTNSPNLIAIVGGLLITLPVVFSLSKVKVVFQIIIPVVVLMVSCLSLILLFSSKTSTIFQKEGEIVNGIIVDKSSLFSLNNSIHTVEVQFKDRMGKNVIASQTTNRKAFNRLYVGDSIAVIYAPSLPNIFRFVPKVKRELNEFDSFSLEELVSLRAISKEHWGEIINSNTNNWKMIPDDSSWVNDEQGALLSVNKNKSISIIYSGFAAFSAYKKNLFESLDRESYNITGFKYDVPKSEYTLSFDGLNLSVAAKMNDNCFTVLILE